MLEIRNNSRETIGTVNSMVYLCHQPITVPAGTTLVRGPEGNTITKVSGRWSFLKCTSKEGNWVETTALLQLHSSLNARDRSALMVFPYRHHASPLILFFIERPAAVE